MSDTEANILLVEDDQNLGFVIQDALKRKAMRYTCAAMAREGLKYFNEHSYDLCVLDVMMPHKGRLQPGGGHPVP
ncbi:MAG: response regulator [Flavobacteriales bacterium]|nr:response regulator [Flavobacteriales bacterium]